MKGKFKEIVSPTAETNNYQTIVNYNKKVFQSTLKNTLNTTIQDIGRLALEVPKNITKNLICFKPNILRFWRQRQAKQKQMNSEEQILKSMRSPGNMEPFILYFILYLYYSYKLIFWKMIFVI